MSGLGGSGLSSGGKHQPAIVTFPEGETRTDNLPEERQTASLSPDESVRVLPLTWGAEQRGYRILERLRDIVLVEVRNEAKIHIGYEVAIIRVLPAKWIAGNKKITPKREIYPSSAKNSDDWGRFAWSYGPNQLGEARERIERILLARDLPKPEEFPVQIQRGADGIRLKVLAPVLKTNGDVYRQLKRQGSLAIFKPDRLSCFEVIQIQTGPPHPMDEHKEDYDLVERYPASELWGTAGWSWQSLALAEAHFAFILKHGPLKDFHRSPEFRAALEELSKSQFNRSSTVSGILF
jgi:hypothetical protein